MILHESNVMGLEKLLINNPETLYWVGFLTADGCFFFPRYCVSLSVSEKDKAHIINFSKFISSNINEYCAKLGNRYFKQYTTSKAGKKEFIKLIKKFQFISDKTHNPPEIDIKNNNLFLSFFIGYIDGDGCIYKDENDNYLSIECHANWENTLNKWFKRCWDLSGIQTDLTSSFKIPKVHITKPHNLARIRTSNWRFLWFLKNKAISLKLPILERKWEHVKKKNKRFEISLKKRITIMNFYKKGLNGDKIAKLLKMDFGYVYEIIRKEKNKLKNTL